MPQQLKMVAVDKLTGQVYDKALPPGRSVVLFAPGPDDAINRHILRLLAIACGPPAAGRPR